MKQGMVFNMPVSGKEGLERDGLGHVLLTALKPL